MLAIVTPAEMAEIDRAAPEPVEVLIARAGWHVARAARSMLGGVYGRRVCVIAGPGNNGADAIVASQILQRLGVVVKVLGPTATDIPACDLVIDGAFGTGMNRDYDAPTAPPGALGLAVDIPSGVDGLTGEVRGRPLTADRTITFAASKPGLLLSPGADLAGQLQVADIGLDVTGASSWLLTDRDAAAFLPLRASTDHKWKRAVWVIGGSGGMYGAPLLAATAALRSGTGMVRCSLPGQSTPPVASEVVFSSLLADEWHTQVVHDEQRFGALIVGPGLGRSPDAGRAVRALIEQSAKPVVVDADALHMLGERPTLRPDVVLTPHDGEYRTLTGAPVPADRFQAARSLATSTGATVVLKGALTVIAQPNGTCLASNSGDARLATAGTGDVLAGMIGSYLAAGLEPARAAVLGAYMHGRAARLGAPVGLIASDLVANLPAATARVMAVDGRTTALDSGPSPSET